MEIIQYEKNRIQTYGQICHQTAAYGDRTAPFEQGMPTEETSLAKKGQTVPP